MVGNTTALTTPGSGTSATRLYIPMQFWFNRNPGLALNARAEKYPYLINAL